jgi:hypothetical protein
LGYISHVEKIMVITAKKIFKRAAASRTAAIDAAKTPRFA